MAQPAAMTLEAFLARLYTDAECRARFLHDRASETARAGLSAEDQTAALAIDATGLRLAARSFAHKRQKQQQRGAAAPVRSRWRRWLFP